MNINVLRLNNPYLSNNKITKATTIGSKTSKINNNSSASSNIKTKTTDIVNTSKKTSTPNINKSNTSVNINNTSAINTNEIISKTERQYFAKLFPDNSGQIEKHVLFNRNGKVVETNARKGNIFDYIG